MNKTQKRSLLAAATLSGVFTVTSVVLDNQSKDIGGSDLEIIQRSVKPRKVQAKLRSKTVPDLRTTVDGVRARSTALAQVRAKTRSQLDVKTLAVALKQEDLSEALNQRYGVYEVQRQDPGFLIGLSTHTDNSLQKFNFETKVFFLDESNAQDVLLYVRRTAGPVIVCQRFHEMPEEVFEILAQPNVCGFVVGMGTTADSLSDKVQTESKNILRSARIVRSVFKSLDIYLGVSWVGLVSLQGPSEQRQWIEATKQFPWTGYMIYNVNSFPWWEIYDRSKVEEILGLEDSLRLVIFEFQGTRRVDDRSRQVWDSQKSILRNNLREWDGFFLFAQNEDNARFKSGILGGLKP